MRLLAACPTPEGARLAALALDACPPERATGLQQRARAALGPSPVAAEVDQVLPAVGIDEADGRKRAAHLLAAGLGLVANPARPAAPAGAARPTRGPLPARTRAINPRGIRRGAATAARGCTMPVTCALPEGTGRS